MNFQGNPANAVGLLIAKAKRGIVIGYIRTYVVAAGDRCLERAHDLAIRFQVADPDIIEPLKESLAVFQTTAGFRLWSF